MRFLTDWIAARRTRQYLSRALVIFSCTPAEAARMDIDGGPCIERVGPRGGRQRALAPPSSQLYSARLSDLRLLYQLLADRTVESAFDSDRRQRRVRLAQLADPFVAALESLDVYGPSSRKAAEMWAAGIPRSTLPEVEGRIFHCVVTAKEAREKGQPVFAWEGPAVPEYELVRGSGPRNPGSG